MHTESQEHSGRCAPNQRTHSFAATGLALLKELVTHTSRNMPQAPPLPKPPVHILLLLPAIPDLLPLARGQLLLHDLRNPPSLQEEKETFQFGFIKCKKRPAYSSNYTTIAPQLMLETPPWLPEGPSEDPSNCQGRRYTTNSVAVLLSHLQAMSPCRPKHPHPNAELTPMRMRLSKHFHPA